METDFSHRNATDPATKRWLTRSILCGIPLIASTLALTSPFARATGDFYEEPLQTLPDYLKLDQLPAKSFQDIAGESRKEPAETPEIHFKEELASLTTKPGREALESIDKMILAARAGHTDFPVAPLLNLLNDARDLFAGPAQAAESASYLEWRLKHAKDFGLDLNAKKGGNADAPEPKEGEAAKFAEELQAKAAQASPALKPHWIYLQGANLFLQHDAGAAQVFFAKVAKEFPKHPRAEAAMFMAARCQISQSRSADYTQQDMKLNAAERPQAKKMLEAFLAKYPHGRFTGDALGWLAAYAYDGQDFGTALKLYIQQTESADHPELFEPACEMVEKTLSHLASAPKDKAFAEVAKSPEAAQALVYLIINTSEADNFDGKIDSIEQVRGWRKHVLPRLGAAIAAEAKLYQDEEWKPRYLAMLAYAASGAGQQEQAAKLLDTAGAAAEESDDLLMARGVVFHRAQKPAVAVDALRTLLKKFPDSPLAAGARLRLALALTDNHQGGEAVLELYKLVEKADAEKKKQDEINKAAIEAAKKADAPGAEKKPDDNANPPAAPDEPASDEDDIVDAANHSLLLYRLDLDQVRALMDTLLNFAPIEELASASRAQGLDPVLRLMLTEPIAQRLLAKEQFEEAKKFMTPAQWELTVGPLARLTKAVEDAKEPAARAEACFKLGEAWAKLRGKVLTYPLDTDEHRSQVYIGYSADANGRRVESAPFIGAQGNYKLDLENRDELKHAFKWWLDASDAQPGTPLTAKSIWGALDVMPKIADVSAFTYERAAARNWTDTAKKLYGRLRTECADSVEAKRYAVAWNFPAPKKKTADDFGTTRPAAGNYVSGTDALNIDAEATSDPNIKPEDLQKGLENLCANADRIDLDNLRKQAESLQSQARKAFSSAYDARWVNLADDLALFFSERDPGREVRKRYVDLRHDFVTASAIGGSGYDDDGQDKGNPDDKLREEIKKALSDPATKPVADYFEFLNLAIISNHFVQVKLDSKDKNGDPDTYRSRDYPQLAKASHAFVEKYPKSKKREAAMLLEARAVFRASEDVEISKNVTWPQAERWEGGVESSYTRQEPFDPKHVLGALDAYDRAYPKGRYAPSIREFRADVVMRMHDWKTALGLMCAQLDDNADPALNGETADNLGMLFEKLLDEHYRADILAAIKANPSAKKYLLKYIDDSPQNGGDNAIRALQYMTVWLHEQLSE